MCVTTCSRVASSGSPRYDPDVVNPLAYGSSLVVAPCSSAAASGQQKSLCDETRFT